MRLISDFALATICIYAEARGESYNGKVAVGEVIRNRCKAWKRTVPAVILQPLQFSWMNSHDPNRIPAFLCDDADITVKECSDAWLASENSNLTNGALNYWRKDSAYMPSWIDKVPDPILIGHHLFGTAP